MLLFLSFTSEDWREDLRFDPEISWEACCLGLGETGLFDLDPDWEFLAACLDEVDGRAALASDFFFEVSKRWIFCLSVE